MTKQPIREQADLFRGEGDGGDDRVARTRNSMLWAAYADAMGFISELVDSRGLKRRTGGASLDRLMPWTRRVGGRGGVNVELPIGCWSDDTQLRMAVSRSITTDGFDVETFARIELPVWPSYALGGGRASKAASRNLGAPGTPWFANTFRGWRNAGGNGAAMRIQPHVWSSPDLDGGYMLEVITDSICTHGHPRAIVGACFHASTLAHCLRTGTVPKLGDCAEIAADLTNVPSLIETHPKLGSVWLGLWEKETGESFREMWHITIRELREAIERVGVDDGETREATDTYLSICDKLGLHAPHQRGSGILTPVAAAALAAIAPNAYRGILTASNVVGTDTDTIATMVGALLGACTEVAPPENPLDNAYLKSEADRLVAISTGSSVSSHRYPDLLTWSAPRIQADALVMNGSQLAVEGLGPIQILDREISWTPDRNFGWQWVQTDFGQTLLIKRRPDVKPIKVGNSPEHPPSPTDVSPDSNGKMRRVSSRPMTPTSVAQLSDPVVLDERLQRLNDMSQTDPPLAISSAMDLMESTARLVLEELGETYNERASFPVLMKSAQRALSLSPETIAPTKRSRDAISRTLLYLSRLALGVAELNSLYGMDQQPSQLRPRHARLAVGGAETYCRFLIDTLKERRV